LRALVSASSQGLKSPLRHNSLRTDTHRSTALGGSVVKLREIASAPMAFANPSGNLWGNP